MSADGLTLVSWNCAGGVRNKWPTLLERVDPDVAILTECSSLPTALLRDPSREVTQVVRKRELDLVSAFSACFPGTPATTKPTIYWQRKQHQAFHIDHVFVPFNWCDRHGFRMAIGSFEDWVATGLSDHVPLVVKIPGSQAPRRKPWKDSLEGRSGPGVRGVTPTEGPVVA